MDPGGPVHSNPGRSVVLARHHPGSAEEDTDRTVHVVPLPLTGEGGDVAALCGARMRPDRMRTVPPGEGGWCPFCYVTHVTGVDPGPGSAAGSRSTGAQRLAAVPGYRKLGWPLILRHEDVVLDLDVLGAVAVIIPTDLATRVAALLTRRRCPPTVLGHPALPHYQVLLAGERYPVPLGWPAGVHRITGTVLLPPTSTARGPVCWVHPPEPAALKLCREFDLFAALRAALTDRPCPLPGSRSERALWSSSSFGVAA
jgi:hypothetical protein